MVNLHIKHSLRGIRKNNLISIFNFLGLILGFGAFLILFIYVNNEKRFDLHFTNAQDIYRVTSMPQGIDGDRWARSLAMVHQAAENIPEVADATWFSYAPVGTIEINKQQIEQKDILSVDKSFVKLFEVKPVSGNIEDLYAPNTAFVTERFVEKYFKGENPVGKIINIKSLQYHQNIGEFEIRGIVENTHLRTHFNYEVLLSQKGNLSERYKNIVSQKVQWVYNYFLLKKGTDPQEIEEALQKYFISSSLKTSRGPKAYKFGLTALTDIHLNSNDRFELKENTSKINISLIEIIAFVVLLISLFNFTNLTIAKVIKHSNELWLKKAIGAKNQQLITQILVEIVMISIVAMLMAVMLVELLKPYINSTFGIDFKIFYNEPFLYIGGAFVLVISTLLVALFTFFLLKRRKQNNAIRGSIAMRPLLIAKVAIVIALISSTLFVNKQVDFMLNSPMGFEKEQVVVLRLKDFSKDPSIFADELRKESIVESVGFTMSHFGYPTQSMQLGNMGLEGNAAFVFANYDYLKTMRIPLKEKMFNSTGDTIRGMVINEHLYNRLMEKHGNMENLNLFISNQTIAQDMVRSNIIGVVEDFNYNTAHHAIGDLVFWLDESRNLARFIHIRLAPSNPHKSIAKLNKIWQQHYPEQQFDYFFLDEKIASHYKSENILSRILITFSLLGILIAIIGISAMSLLISQQKTKEIGVRKVNGAKTIEILSLFNKYIIKWIIIAFIISSPIVYFVMNKWLENFAYKTELSWWVFALAGGIALFIALATVSWQSWRAARRNPVEALRYE